MRLTDFLGREFGVGDHVIYAGTSDRSANIVYGTVADIYEVYYSHTTWKWERVPDSGVPDDSSSEDPQTRVKVMPLRGARWKQTRGRTFYVDTRNGKRIDPDAPSGKHILKPSHYVYGDGTELDLEAERTKMLADIESRSLPGSWRRRQEYEDNEDGLDRWLGHHYHVHIGGTIGFREAYRFGPKDKLNLTPIWWVSRTYQPWVQEGNEQKPVTLTSIENIVRVDAPEDLA